METTSWHGLARGCWVWIVLQKGIAAVFGLIVTLLQFISRVCFRFILPKSAIGFGVIHILFSSQRCYCKLCVCSSWIYVVSSKQIALCPSEERSFSFLNKTLCIEGVSKWILHLFIYLFYFQYQMYKENVMS